MSFVKVMIHAVWGTKNREPFLTHEIRAQVIEHILQNARSKQIYIDSLNGHVEHLHCLFGLNADITLSKAMQLIKGESAFWINKNRLTRHKFEWADEYFAVSVSESMIDKVRTYIQRQEEHHSRIAFIDEYEEFIRKYRFRSSG
ncbi:MAG TPA: IS200/IS605 family transposase [Cyclobacteriaceae bacterium]|nr:IS200/IS605 family transposase [Cyclobacteriaceae bacterium]